MAKRDSTIRRPVFLLGRGRHTTVIDIVDPPLDPVIRSSVHCGRVVHHVGSISFLSRAAAVEHVGAPAPDQYRQNIHDSFPERSGARPHPYHVDD